MQTKSFEEIEKQVIQYFLEKDAPVHLRGFKYVTYIITNRLMNGWAEKNIMLEYSKTGKHFGASESKVERCIRHFIEKSNENQKNTEYLGKLFYLLKVEEVEEQEE
ncbi:MAG: sporulation initiation factor Spo0A C-terminal domain-containing protein [Eubacteriales bacterium]|nr:sporulation initiation factor Spo0A C-terminal domain-containing protein [Eubacteriales bacterium]